MGVPPGSRLTIWRQKWVAGFLHDGVRRRSVTFTVHINLVVVFVVVVEFVAR